MGRREVGGSPQSLCLDRSSRVLQRAVGAEGRSPKRGADPMGPEEPRSHSDGLSISNSISNRSRRGGDKGKKRIGEARSEKKAGSND